MKGKKGVMGQKFAEDILKITNLAARRNKEYVERGGSPTKQAALYIQRQERVFMLKSLG